jgi:hypothetical protein
LVQNSQVALFLNVASEINDDAMKVSYVMFVDRDLTLLRPFVHFPRVSDGEKIIPLSQTAFA